MVRACSQCILTNEAIILTNELIIGSRNVLVYVDETFDAKVTRSRSVAPAFYSAILSQ
jgi:hypothetical protein